MPIKQTDVAMRKTDTILTFAPLTNTAKTWIEEHVPRSMRCGQGFLADREEGATILATMKKEGLVCKLKRSNLWKKGKPQKLKSS